MISLKRNKQGELVKAKGRRVQRRHIYEPFQEEQFKVSRGRFENFLNCPRCFYLDRVGGLAEPGTPGWALNSLTDDLLKKEFDRCRDEAAPHRLFERFGLNHVVPFRHKNMDRWRDSLHHGLQAPLEGTPILLTGGVDDIWENQDTGKLIVVDYKSQSSVRAVETKSYLSGMFHQGYKRQLDFYAYLLHKLGFSVDPTGYFYVCNAIRDAEGFFGVMNFEETLVAYPWDTSWIPGKLTEMVAVMNSRELPTSNPACENCAYARERSLLET